MFRILLADDEGIMLESLKKIITTSFGSECDIRCVKTGRGVVEMAESFTRILHCGHSYAGTQRNPGHPGNTEGG